MAPNILQLSSHSPPPPSLTSPSCWCPQPGQGPAGALSSFFTSVSPSLANYRSGAGSQAGSTRGQAEAKRQGPSLPSPKPTGLPDTAGTS